MKKPIATPINPALNQIKQEETTQPQISVPSEPRSQWDTFIKPFEGQISQTMINVLAIAGLLILREIIQPYFQRQAYKLSYSREQEHDIEQTLIELRGFAKCERVMLTQFTNGVFTMSEQSIKGCSITNEITDSGVTKVAGIINSQIMGYAHFILKSFDKESFKKRVADEVDEESYRSFLESIQASFSINYFLTARDEPLGFISLHWKSRSPETKLIFDSISEKDIRRSADKIIFILLKRKGFAAKLKAVLGAKIR
jgi:hypothetical protein